MKICDDIIGDNDRIQIISGDGKPAAVPRHRGPLLRSTDVIVAIPDMHMYHYNSPLDGFRFGAEAMLDFLLHLEALSRRWYAYGRRLRIFQLGDLFELWFPNPHNGPEITSYDIWRSHPLYSEIGRLFWDLGVQQIIGNHDYKKGKRSEGSMSFGMGNIHIEHGCRADQWYRFSNPGNILWRPAMSIFRAFRQFESGLKNAPLAGRLRHASTHRAWGNESGEIERSDFPDPRDYPRHSLDYYSRRMAVAAENDGLKSLYLVAHTHLPYLDTEFVGGRGIYLDAGAWSYGRTDFAIITSEEIAICHYRRTPTVLPANQYRHAI